MRVPAGATLVNPLHGPESEVAVAYTLSLVPQPVRCEPSRKYRPPTFAIAGASISGNEATELCAVV